MRLSESSKSILTEINVIATVDADKRLSAEIQYRNLNFNDRLFASFKVLGLCWGLALLSILIPIVHFVLVPSFLICGIAMFYRQMGLHEVIESCELTCPVCLNKFLISKKIFNWPKREPCPKCEADLLLRLKKK